MGHVHNRPNDMHDIHLVVLAFGFSYCSFSMLQSRNLELGLLTVSYERLLYPSIEYYKYCDKIVNKCSYTIIKLFLQSVHFKPVSKRGINTLPY